MRGLPVLSARQTAKRFALRFMAELARQFASRGFRVQIMPTESVLLRLSLMQNMSCIATATKERELVDK
jgi:hypothetical protein